MLIISMFLTGIRSRLLPIKRINAQIYRESRDENRDFRGLEHVLLLFCGGFARRFFAIQGANPKTAPEGAARISDEEGRKNDRKDGAKKM